MIQQMIVSRKIDMANLMSYHLVNSKFEIRNNMIGYLWSLFDQITTGN